MTHSSNPYDISPEAVQARLEAGETLQLLDVRQPWEYEQYHIPGALHIPLGELASRYTDSAEELDPSTETICICEHGIRSANAAQFLAAQGFLNIANMTGGMAEYHGPVETGPPESSS